MKGKDAGPDQEEPRGGSGGAGAGRGWSGRVLGSARGVCHLVHRRQPSGQPIMTCHPSVVCLSGVFTAVYTGSENASKCPQISPANLGSAPLQGVTLHAGDNQDGCHLGPSHRVSESPMLYLSVFLLPSWVDYRGMWSKAEGLVWLWPSCQDGPGGARSLDVHPSVSHGGRDPSTWVIFCLLPTHINRELGYKWSR